MKTRKHITLDEPEASTMSRDDQIAILEKQLADPKTGARECAALSRQISILKGDIEPGVYHRLGVTGKSVERRKLKPDLEGKGLGPALSRVCFEGFWYLQIVRNLAGLTSMAGDLIPRLSSSERKHFEAEAERIQAMTPEEREAWEDEEMTKHPLWG